MTESEVRSKLTEYRTFLLDMQSAIRTIRTLEEKALATGSLAPKEVDVLSSGSLSSRWEEIITNKVDLESIIDAEMRNFEKTKAETITFICNAEPSCRIILLAYYIDGLTNREVAEALHYDIRTIKRMKRKGISQIAKVVTTMSPPNVI